MAARPSPRWRRARRSGNWWCGSEFVAHVTGGGWRWASGIPPRQPRGCSSLALPFRPPYLGGNRYKGHPMTTFDDRERAFEAKFARDEDIAFRVTARRNRLVGQWAAAKMGLTPEETDAYA